MKKVLAALALVALCVGIASDATAHPRVAVVGHNVGVVTIHNRVNLVPFAATYGSVVSFAAPVTYASMPVTLSAVSYAAPSVALVAPTVQVQAPAAQLAADPAPCAAYPATTAYFASAGAGYYSTGFNRAVSAVAVRDIHRVAVVRDRPLVRVELPRRAIEVVRPPRIVAGIHVR